ncbi:MAG: hypothetical protein ACJ0F1_04855 [Crocinitomicaceae bacterium]|nr:hypothetical protein [Crocinitomicaceae bacterium]OUT72570.1 MAG: hypothetical protein CBB76_01095 [Crocinitomicaceae bacterium TMED16]|tara:strand:- start:165 stop:479 length:315 start_codon:yes stop_codon:yes gene_type:complete
MPKFQIQKLEFNSFNDWITMQGKIVKGYLKSEYTLKVEVSQINRILNLIQKLNPEASVYDCLSSYTQNDYSEYKFDFESLISREVSFTELQTQTTRSELRMIRA